MKFTPSFIRIFSLFILLYTTGFILPACAQNKVDGVVRVAGAMRNVMWKGEIEGIIKMDSLARPGMYGIGPLESLAGELMLFDGMPYYSFVGHDSFMLVDYAHERSAPFFVYAEVREWKQIPIPDSVLNVPSLEHFLDAYTNGYSDPFVFWLEGFVDSAAFHIQNLPAGTVIRSPEDAHTGQVTYVNGRYEVDLLGFFSRKHQGIFTHHDTYIHVHVLTKNREGMGHLEKAHWSPGAMRLYVPAHTVK